MQKNKTLVKKIGMLIGIMLAVVFAVFISVTVYQAKSGIDNATMGELQAVAKSNGLMIQNILDSAEVVVKDMNSYLVNMETHSGKELEGTLDDTEESQVYANLMLTKDAYAAENYLIYSAGASIENNDDIIGAGAYFEPYMFSSNQKSYSMYIDYSTGKLKVENRGEFEEYSNREFYKNAMSAGKLFFSNPYNDAKTGELMVTVSMPVMLDGKAAGVVFADISLKRFDEINVLNERYLTLRYCIVTNDGTVAYHSTQSNLIGSSLETTFQNAADNDYAAQQIDTGNAFYFRCKDANGVDVFKFFYPISASDGTWAIANTVDAKDLNEETTNTTILLIVISVLSLILIVAASVWILHKMLKPIGILVEAANEISKGNLNIQIAIDSNDEIGLLANAFQNTATNLKRMIGEISSILGQIAQNHLDVAAKEEYTGDFVQIKLSLDNIIDNLNSVMSNINIASNQVACSADQVASGAQALSQGATEQAGVVEELTATINEISEQVQINAENAKQANQQAFKAGSEIEESNEKMNHLIQAMEDISNSSKKIEKIIKTIEDIAFQTNILALNAAVEAARAGVAGKGFAVVADEVRNLASKSAEAAKNTTQLIGDSISSVNKGANIVDETAHALSLVVEDVKNTAITIEKITDATERQASAIIQVTQGMDQVSAVVQTNSATAEESAASSEELSGQAQTMRNLVGRFRLKKQAGYDDNPAEKRV